MLRIHYRRYCLAGVESLKSVLPAGAGVTNAGNGLGGTATVRDEGAAASTGPAVTAATVKESMQ
eukprot:CAMPEP_0181057084 /NCGR_PEP_ID=MMETSP1070-20121207/20057_1 /TAXON_ID=265543 /ORGANISM="Minutocellus polymorphus, Strain NH13" /LENGTH=63 /DNA_ID=CAMNT_0023136465 /DNA_START=103 /DNA_END=291 /DNA_ORIENTATION=+